MRRTSYPASSQHWSAPPSDKPLLPHIGALDGLRAVAVLAVLFYHAEFEWMPGGFLGVEVFFVISGFLITALLLAEYERNGTVDLKAFWARRSRRLLPALAFYVVGAFAIARVLAPDVSTKLWRELWAVAAYVYNWFGVVNEISYTEGFERPSFFHHLWSLAIEEQFYLVWPLVVWAGLRFMGPRLLTAVVVGGAVASTIWRWSLYEPLEDPLRLYYGTDTRASGLLIGAALALLWRPWRTQYGSRRAPRTTDAVVGIAGVVGLIGLGYGAYQWSFDAIGVDWLFRGGFLAIDLFTVAVIAAVVIPRGLLGMVFAHPALRWVGVRSYGIYLWHWPVFQVTRSRVDVTLDGWTLFALQMAITMVLVEISYQLIEMPARRGELSGALRRLRSRLHEPRVVGWAVGTPLALVVCFAAVTQAHHAFDGDRVEVVVAAGAAIDDQAAPPTPAPTATPEAREVVVEAPLVAPSPTPGPVAEATVAPEPDPPAADPEPTPDSVDGDSDHRGLPELGAILAQVLPTPTPTPEPEPTPDPGPAADAGGAPIVIDQRVTFFGDSVMEGASAELEALAIEATVDTEVGRQWWDMEESLEAFLDEDDLGDIVVIHLGSNGAFTTKTFDAVMESFSEADVVVLVGVRVPRRWETRVNDALVEGAERFPNSVFVDWYDIANDSADFFAEDGVHLTTSGRTAYSEAIRTAIIDELEPAIETDE